MNSFENYNPISVFIYFMTVTVTAMICYNPVLILLSFFGSISFYITLNKAQKGKTHVLLFALILVSAAINPIFNHNGATVLFIMNNNPVTLEAFIYGVFLGIMIAYVMYWFAVFSQIMTSDKLLYLFGRISPKTALLLSMTLRYIPLFSLQIKKVSASQKTLGVYTDESIPDKLRGGIRVFSVMVTWALENGIITADSMTARGYGIGKRTHFSPYRFKVRDFVLSAVSLTLFTVSCVAVASGTTAFSFYPYMSQIPLSAFAFLSYFCYGIAVFIPTFIEIKEVIRWKYSESKI